MSDYLWNKTLAYESLLKSAVDAVERHTLEEGELGFECLEMAEAYLTDGQHFLQENDLPDALAAFSYGHGWLDAGVRLGVLTVSDTEPFTI